MQYKLADFINSVKDNEEKKVEKEEKVFSDEMIRGMVTDMYAMMGMTSDTLEECIQECIKSIEKIEKKEKQQNE